MDWAARRLFVHGASKCGRAGSASNAVNVSTDDRAAIVDGQSVLLADTYTLYLKTRNFHWNVTGPIVATEMISHLVGGHETVARTARALFPLVEGARDAPTADLLTQRLQVHERPRGCCAACSPTPARKTPPRQTS